MAPVGDAVRLVHHQQPGGGGQLGQDQVAEPRVVQPLRADQQHVDRPGRDLGVDLVPLGDVGRVDRAGVQAGPGRRVDLVAHQREQRGDDHGRPRAAGPEQRGGHEVDRGLAPAGALHDQRPAAAAGQRLDRGPLVRAQPGLLPGQRAQAALGLVAQAVAAASGGRLVSGGGSHASLVISTHRHPAGVSPWQKASSELSCQQVEGMELRWIMSRPCSASRAWSSWSTS